MYAMNALHLFEEELTPTFVKPTLISLSYKPQGCSLPMVQCNLGFVTLPQ